MLAGEAKKKKLNHFPSPAYKRCLLKEILFGFFVSPRPPPAPKIFKKCGRFNLFMIIFPLSFILVSEPNIVF